MLILTAVLTGLLGLAIGSFLNVVIWRVPRGESIVHPPSACPKCQTQISNRDNVPVLGWLLLRGKCRTCAEPISARYPLVEALTGALFVVLTLKVGLDPVLPAYLYLAAMGVALAFIDLDVRRLPDVIVLPSYAVVLVLLGVGELAGSDSGELLRALLGAAAMGTFYFVLWFAYPKGMGYGDVKLSPVLGALTAWFGWGAWAVGLFGGFFLGGIWGIGLMASGKGGRKSKVPFGPWMLLGVLLAVLCGQGLADGYLDLTTGS